MLTREQLRAGADEVGFREGREWLLSPEPLRLESAAADQIERLGHPLRMFQLACDRIYRRSVHGTLPGWVAELLDAGKPAWMVEGQRADRQRDVTPRVIRPDLLLTEKGFALTELDAVPGGMGVTGWLSEQYEAAGFALLGEGMPESFRQLLPEGGQILVSEEAADYRPEMEWLAKSLNRACGERWQVSSAEEFIGGDGPLYRFFELFDWESLSAARHLAERADLTSPFKPHFEEKLWLALLWCPSLREVWKEELRGSHLRRLRDLVPYGWVLDPAPLPPHAVFPRIDLNAWSELGGLSQKERRLVLKISGFSELAWGSRGVVIGHDSSREEWGAAIARAGADFDSQPWLLQEFREAKLIEHPYFDPQSGEVKIMQGRARLCPYYFIDAEGATRLGGCLAAVVPPDKKKIHGMRNAILVPCMR